MFRYVPFKEPRNTDGIGDYISIGIKALNNGGEEVLSISDVSSDEPFVTSLCEHYTDLQVSPIHLRDVLMDEL